MARIITRREARSRRMRFQVVAGMLDFIGILAGIIAIVVCVLLLSALVRWVIADVQSSFATLWDIFMSALIIPE